MPSSNPSFRFDAMRYVFSLGVLFCVGSLGAVAAEERDSVPAAKVDRLLSEEIPHPKAEIAPQCNDETFLRRASLDLIGRPPTVEQIAAFCLDPDKGKRQKLVERLLDDKRFFGQNWGRYWRDVIMYRRSEDRAVLASRSAEEFLAGRFNDNTPWNEIAAAFVTAEGDVRENGETAIIMAQSGRPEETVAELSRIFLGIQIQCAQCHDHPTDRWKREQFHQLAAFFPRVAVRPNRAADKRSFIVAANDRPFARRRRNNNNRYQGTPEHRMANLEDPAIEGKLMQPVFFVTGDKLDMGARDADRRESLAKWMTGPENPWFAKAFVNRIWSELVGEGFYEPVDDMGPDRSCSAPKTLDYLSRQFVEQGHDVKWLLSTITATDAYQRQSRSRRTTEQQPFAANCSQRLRGDQLYDSLVSLLGIQQRAIRGAPRGSYGAAGPRAFFNQAFGYDPSQIRDEVAGSIQQALALMNSPQFNRAISARPGTRLGRLLWEIPNNEELVVELYLLALSRQPTPREIKTCLGYVQQVGDRSEAFEDLLWSLMNSTEFIHRK